MLFAGFEESESDQLSDLQQGREERGESFDDDFVATSCDPNQCPNNIFKHLKDRCEPIYGDSCCPLAFNCGKL